MTSPGETRGSFGLSWPPTVNQALLTVSLILSYVICLATYRLYLSPLAKIPGPKLAALTSLYAGYHDLYRGGQYVWVIEEMHKKYGPIVRIRPDVLHVNDPDYIEQIYTRAQGSRREKYKTTLRLLRTPGAILGTKDHDLHRSRRAVLNPFFSMQNVRRLEPIIQQTLLNLFSRLEKWGHMDVPAPMNTAYKATTKDIIHAYAFGDGEKCLEMDDLNEAFFESMAPVWTNHLGTYFPIIIEIMNILPPRLVTMIMPRVAFFVRFVQGLNVQIETIRNAKDQPDGRTIFHEILRADIPDSEKSSKRLSQEAMILLIAGMETTAQTLTALTYHLLSNPPILRRLKQELELAMPDPNQLPIASKLDSLPYLNAVIQEGIRLHPGVSIRQDRVAPDQDLFYQSPSGKNYVIPAGTAVGMTAPLLNRLENLYPSPHSFSPERYLSNPGLTRYQLAFSKGTRQCIGMNLAYTELQCIIAGIFRRYDVYNSSKERQSGPTLELFQTGREDVDMACDFVTTAPKPGSSGVKLVVRL